MHGHVGPRAPSGPGRAARRPPGPSRPRPGRRGVRRSRSRRRRRAPAPRGAGRHRGACRRAARSARAAPTWPAGRNSKIPPPSLSTTTTVRSMPRAAAPSSPLASWRNATSPMRSTVGVAEPSATPTAVETTPSMPLAPRLARTRTPSRGAPYHSTSRTGIDDDTTRLAPSGSAARTSRATPGSVGSARSASVRPMASWALASADVHRAPHGVPVPAREAGRTAPGTRRSGRPSPRRPRCARGRSSGRTDRPAPAERPRPPATGPGPSTPADDRAGARPSACGRPRSARGGGGRRTPPPSWREHPAARRRVGQHGPAGARRQPVHRSGVAGPGAGDDHASLLVEQRRRGRRAGRPRAPRSRRAGGSTARRPGAPRGGPRPRRRAGHGTPG